MATEDIGCVRTGPGSGRWNRSREMSRANRWRRQGFPEQKDIGLVRNCSTSGCPVEFEVAVVQVGLRCWCK